MGFPGLGQGQGWSAATLPLSSQAPAPSLYLRSQNHIHSAGGVGGGGWCSGTGPLPATHTGWGGKETLRSDAWIVVLWSLLVHIEIFKNAVNWCSVLKLKST